MCGIAGAAWTSSGTPLDEATLRHMTDVLVHRGPDDEGHWRQQHSDGSGVALGFRRLSIIDLAGGHQPLSNEDGSIWIAFNGEIYNYRELQPELTDCGHQFRTHSDTEVIVHAYEEWGIDCLQRFRGMFAFAIWDARQQRLFLARDRMGQKPLFYRGEAERLTFASELKALLQVPKAPRELDPESVDLFLTFQYVPHPRSILKGYNKLPPAHYAVYQHGQLTVAPYWHPPFESATSDFRFADERLRESASWTNETWRQRVRDTLTDSVRLRMRSDVPIGAFLSGGIDSTIISGLMQSLSDRPIHTFSIGFPIKKFDERQYAREAAKRIGTEHHEFLVDPSAIAMLPQIIWQYDEPFGDSSAIPTMYLSKVTRNVVTVALSGDGGDELFAGYERYQAVRLAQRFDWLPRPLRKFVAADLWQTIPTSTEQKSIGRRIKRFAHALGLDPERRYLRWIGIFDEQQRRQLYTSDFRESLSGFDSAELILNAYEQAPGRDLVTRTTAADVLTYLPCDILTKVDIASMTYSLEARSPFLDHHVAELAARMPLHLKQDGGRGKLILVEAFRDLLPQSIQTRRKMGFGVPIDHWFRKELQGLLRDTLQSTTARERGILDSAAVDRLIDEHVSGGWDHSYRLWNLVCLELWCRMFLDDRVLTGPSIIS
ncbi:MAG: asparagine synthase (glutamine-hydrolyzing) [Planctomycetaceae bacterium]